MKKLFILAILSSISSFTMAGSSATATATNAADSSNTNNGNTVNFNGPEESRSSMRYSGEYDVKTVPNVSAPGLTTTLTETCMGSTSAGVGVVGLGVSFGTTWRDSACVRRLDARQLAAIGYNLGAKELMCDSDAVRAALKRAGKPCFVDLPADVQTAVNPDAAADVVKPKKLKKVVVPAAKW